MPQEHWGKILQEITKNAKKETNSSLSVYTVINPGYYITMAPVPFTGYMCMIEKHWVLWQYSKHASPY